MPDAALSNRERAEALVAKVLDAEAEYRRAVAEYDEACNTYNAASDRRAEAIEALDNARAEASDVLGLS